MTCVAQHTLSDVRCQDEDLRKLNGLKQYSTPDIPVHQSGCSPSKMRLSDSVASDFDISSILARVSDRESNDTSMVNDGLFNILDKISTTGQQLKDELQNAKLREDHLVREMHQLKSRENDSLQLSPIKGSPCSLCRGEVVPMRSAGSDEIKEKCEKLQNALLSLEEENMRLNRLLRQMPSGHSYETSVIAGDGVRSPSLEKLEQKEREVEALRDQLVGLQKLLTEAREEIVKQKQLKADLLKEASKTQTSAMMNTSVSEDQLIQLQQKANSLQKQNRDYLERIENLEEKLRLTLDSTSTEEMYKLRINDLQNLLVIKEKEKTELKERLSFVMKDLAEKDKKAKAVQSKDISKRKEVLLLCEKYEQLKKRVKRLESDLHNSQQKLQESNTKCWALETSLQRTVEENEVLKNQLELLEGFMTTVKTPKTSRDATGLVKDYEKLTGKYEELLSLRLREYEKLKSSSRNKKLLRKIGAHHNAEEYDRRKQIRKLLFSDNGRRDEVMEELMWRREQDMRRFNAQVDNPMVRRSATHEVADRNHPYDLPSDREYHYEMERNSYRRHAGTGNGAQPALRHEPPLPFTNINLENQIKMDVPRQKIQGQSECEHLLPHPDVKPSLTPHNKDHQHSRTNLHGSLTGDQRTLQSANLHSHRMTSTPVKKSLPAPNIPSNPAPSRFQEPLQTNSLPVRSRSKSLSPVRPALNDKSLNDSQNSTGRDSQKSVSFCLTPTHRRTNSASKLDSHFNDLKLTPRTSPTTNNKSISPVEVLERVKSAYQEEYIRNMDGVGISFPSLKASQAELKTSATQPSDASSLYGERLKTMSDNVKQFVEKSYLSSSLQQSRELYRNQETSKPKSPSPKSILKKPRIADQIVTAGRRTPSPLPQPETCKTPTVVREKTPSHASEYNPHLENFSSSMDEKKHSYPPIEIVDVNPTPIDRNGNRLSFNSSTESMASNKQSRKKKGEERIVPTDLSAPIQFSKLHKDDDEEDSDTVSQSSMSSTTDHIGRFEFLQEMRSSLKNPSFAYQKPMQKQPCDEEDVQTTEKNTSGELGLSARQQEYAEKLIKKYMKGHAKGENHKDSAVICD